MLGSSQLAFEGGVITITGGRGPQGVQGPAGSATLSVEAGEDIIVNRMVYANGGKVYHADPTDPDKAAAVIGLAIQSVSAGGQVLVLTYGERNDGNFGWGSGGDLFLGTNGALTITPPTTGTLLRVGVITSSSSIIINIQQPLILS